MTPLRSFRVRSTFLFNAAKLKLTLEQRPTTPPVDEHGQLVDDQSTIVDYKTRPNEQNCPKDSIEPAQRCVLSSRHFRLVAHSSARRSFSRRTLFEAYTCRRNRRLK